MKIVVVNLTEIPVTELEKVMVGINREVREEFEKCWDLEANVVLVSEQELEKGRHGLLDVDAYLYLWGDEPNLAAVHSYHNMNHKGADYGYVFTKLSSMMAEAWMVSLSLEAVRLVVNFYTGYSNTENHEIKIAKPNNGTYHWMAS